MYNKIQESILSTIDYLLSNKLKSVKFDFTERGKVVSISSDKTSCDVEINGHVFTCKIRNGISISVNDVVLVKVLNNNYSDKIVDGKIGAVIEGGSGEGGTYVSSDFDHNQLKNYKIEEHRKINDLGESNIDLWSAQKIKNEINNVSVDLEWDNIEGKPISNALDIDDAVEKSHDHTNKSLLDSITQVLVDRWNSAWTHINDSIKHITSSERTLWNTVSDKSDKVYVDTELNKKVDKVAGKQLSTEDYTTQEKNKLASVDNNANNYTHPNHTGDVTSSGDGVTIIANNAVTFAKMQQVATSTFLGRNTTGNGNIEAMTVAQVKTQLSIGNVENKSSATIRGELTSGNVTTALGFTPENSANKGANGGYAGLDSNGKVPLAQLPDTARQQTYVVTNTTARNALTGLISGDKCYETSTGDTYIWNGTSWLTQAKADWENINLQWSNVVGRPTSTVTSIDSAVTNSHTHTNKTVLDGISSTNVTNWGTAYTHSQTSHAPTNAEQNQTLTSGNGMASWTATSGNLTITLGTPSTITNSTTNSLTATSHTHEITMAKADVGLGSVENYGIATKVEAETGTSNIKYMTPLRTKEAIASYVGSDNIAKKVTFNFGNGSATQFDITHNLGTQDVNVSIFENATNSMVMAEVVALSTSAIRIFTGSAPTSNQYRVVIVG